ncbi:hypothetical protein FSP39_001945 [Pinctada imbricata]|uniref:C1q domain-containing protein n=1 Tax=Pinctada imbricata TaxID=66713 RepID=A0AA88XKQ7_PINIB|nr:hypothetical protein FSP39_001945 [Pinctada imbricata]
MVIKFDSVLTNEGNGYDKTTGTFTAPKNGMYLFSWKILSHVGKKAHAHLYVNNKETWLNYADDGPQGYDTGSATVILRLNQTDKAEIRTHGTSNYLHEVYTTFTGTLLYN